MGGIDADDADVDEQRGDAEKRKPGVRPGFLE
jgi:hypothetical protein